MPHELAYAATKGGVDAFTLSLSAAVAGRGITVNAVDPGPTDKDGCRRRHGRRCCPARPRAG